MTLKNRIIETRGDAAGMERLYRHARDQGEEPIFKDAIVQCAAECGDDILLSAWAHRLDLKTVSNGEPTLLSFKRIKHWKTAVGASVVLGVAFALLAGDRPPVPIPGEGTSQFWIGWAPLTALFILGFLAAVSRDAEPFRRYGRPGALLVILPVLAAMVGWDRDDDIAGLLAVHLPVAVWAIVGAGVALGRSDAASQQYAFLVKSAEAILAAGIYFAAGGIFLALTFGIFSVLGIELPEDKLHLVGACGLGAVPILALASVYDPTMLPVLQDWSTGLSRILQLLTRIFLPLALGVLVVYVLWFIPTNFWHPFREREALIVYNATILAVLMLLSIAVSGRAPGGAVLRHALLALAVLTALLNTYALAANLTRVFELGLTPNRYAVAGWNVVTMLMLSTVIFRLWRGDSEQWVQRLRRGIAVTAVVAAAWAAWVVVGLPLSFS